MHFYVCVLQFGHSSKILPLLLFLFLKTKDDDKWEIGKKSESSALGVGQKALCQEQSNFSGFPGSSNQHSSEVSP